MICASRVDLNRIQSLRALFLQENYAQVRYNACHEQGWTDSYLLTADGAEVGYGSTKGEGKQATRDTVFEFFVASPFRTNAARCFRELLRASGVTRIECQTNHPLLTAMIFEFGCNINADTALFEEGMPTALECPGAVFRRRREDDRPFEHLVEPVGDYILELDGPVIATGGFLTHYNEPFVDIYMEVEPSHRRKGAGSFLVQEIIKRCHVEGKIPAARCGVENIASRATLTRAGLRPCGFMLAADVRAVSA